MLSEEEKVLVADTWRRIAGAQDARTHGMKFFQHLFTQHPDLQKRFFPFMDATDMVRLGDHGEKVVRTVGNLVEAVEAGDETALAQEVKGLMTASLVEYLGMAAAETAGGKMSPEAKAAWRKLLAILVHRIERETKAM